MAHYYGRIVGVEIYKQDVVVVRQGLNNNPPPALRGKVTEFSKASRRRLAFVASNTTVPFRTMITLTYPKEYPSDGVTVKGHLRRFLTWLKKETGDCEYLWFLEFQARGAPHFHILTDWPLPTNRANKVLWYAKIGQTWYDVVGSGDYKHRLAGTRTETLRSKEGGARYCVKYAQKMRQKEVPEAYQNVGRFWGHTTRVKPEPESQHRCTEDDVRGMLEGWKYAPSEQCPVWRVLYNQGEWAREYVKGTIAKHPDVRYTARSEQIETGLVAAPPRGKTKGVLEDGSVFACPVY
jgi:hypothetical protein